jgi:hypothetical protein
MNNKIVKLLLSCTAFLTLHSLTYTQTQWHLQNYLLRTGKAGGEEMGKAVKGIGDYDHDSNIEVAVADWPYTQIWSITANTDTVPKTRFRGVILEKGDINGDGYPDFVIGKPYSFGSGGPMDTVFIYFGDSTGIDTIPNLILTGENQYDDFGRSIAIGDINHDGIDDLVICADAYPGELYRGRVYIYFGRKPFVPVPDFVMTGDTTQSGWGEQCYIADVNGDGTVDLILNGADVHDQQHPENYFCYLNVYFGGSPFDTTIDFKLRGYSWYGSTNSLGLMDANGDGYTDILWAYQDSTKPAKLRIYYGGASLDTIPDFIIPPPLSIGANFNSAWIANAGDMDGDGFDDIAISDPYANQQSGFVLIYRGGPKIDTTWDAGAGQVRGGYFGYSIDGIGDINGDGLSDIIVGEYGYTFNSNIGAFSIYLGNKKIDEVKERPTNSVPQVFKLEQNFPNPFNPKTEISFSIRKEAHVTLRIYDILGREVAPLVNEKKAPGAYSVSWNTRNVSAGVYFYQLTVTTSNGQLFSDTKKMILLS